MLVLPLQVGFFILVLPYPSSLFVIFVWLRHSPTGIALFTYHKYTSALHSAVPLDAHGNPLEEEDAEEVLAVVRSNTLNAGNEEGLRLLEDGGEIEVPVSALAYEDDDDEAREGVRHLEEAAEGGHGDGEIGAYSHYRQLSLGC